ncbi:MAG: right-handed parallel beta-helix repeat-containing protein, partial [Thermoplasmata archaeon]|nr:right-handed parallel beta-helix repeat-containing protein [Thermoplasmata archaeon]
MKKIFSVLVVSIFIISTLFFWSSPFINTYDTASAEWGAPPINGTTTTTWFIQAMDFIHRVNEDIKTADIRINPGGTMNWANVTCETTGNITIYEGGSFNLINSKLTLTGNLTINGTVTFRNTTLNMNPTQNGEYYITVQTLNGGLFIYDLDSDPLTQNDNSMITSAIPDGNHRYNFWVEKDSHFIMKNSELSQCGFDNTFQGLTIRTNNTLLENCTIINNYIGVTYESNANNSIINCNISQNNDAGIRISDSAYNNEIKNCEFNNNQYGIVINLANNNQVSGCDFAGSSSSHIYIHNSSNNDFSSCDGVSGMQSIELSTNSINNNFNNCNMEFNAGDIVYIYESKDNVFTDCNFTNGGLNGVSLSGASNNSFIDCNISKNLGWGIYIYSNQDEGNIILNSVVSDNIGEGVRIESSASRNRIISSKISNNSIGIYLKSSSGIDVLSTNITSNTNYGVYFFTGARNNILSTNLSNNPKAIYFTKKSRDNYINDSVIYNSSFFDLMIEGSSNLTAINTIFSRNDIDIKDSSNVTVKWYLNAKAEDFATGTPLEYAVVSIKDAIHSTYHSQYKTDDTGWTKTIMPTETFITATSIFKHTPHRIRASKSGYEPEIQDVTIDTNLDLIFRLKERVQPLLPDFVVDNISISNVTPLQNQEITINVTILNNGTENLTGQNIFVEVIIDNNTLIHGANISSLLINSYEHVITNWIVNVTNG